MLKKTIFGFIVFSIFSISIALEVFVWDYDMGYQIANLDEGGTYSVETAIVNALNENGIYPEVDESLPNANVLGYKNAASTKIENESFLHDLPFFMVKKSFFIQIQNRYYEN